MTDTLLTKSEQRAADRIELLESLLRQALPYLGEMWNYSLLTGGYEVQKSSRLFVLYGAISKELE